MKASLNTICGLNKRYSCADDITAIGLEKLIEKIGAQLGAVEEVIKVGDKYQGIVIAKVISCESHPNADKLKVCTIDDGCNTPSVKREPDGYIQVVCGAPNVHPGLTVAWLPPGTTVPETIGKEPFVLEAREIRGVISNGMLASAKELALGNSHAGIMEIDGSFKPGTDFAEAFGLKDDVVLDFENKMFTHRPDCFGFLGISRELAGIQGVPFKSPDWYNPNPQFPDVEGDKLPLVVKNELPRLVPRFPAIAMSQVQVGPSPAWLQVELAKVGQNSINNIVDYTNFFMLLTGQPLHAYDYDKVKALSDGETAIVIRNPKPGEKIRLLNGKEIEPRIEAIMIATNKQLIGIGGVMGGVDTDVDENTRNIILECANFDMYSVRRTSMAHGLFTDAVTRFTKGQSPLQNLAVLAKIVDEIRQFGGGKVASVVIDDKHLEKALSDATLFKPVQVSKEFINSRLGLALSDEDIIMLLQNVEFQVHTKGSSGELYVEAPFWRTDIELAEDIVEEVGRLYGYDKLPLELPKRDLMPTAKDPLLTLKAEIRERLSGAGANEVLTYSFVPGKLLGKTGQDKSKAYQVANALSPDLQYYRLSLMPSLLDKVHSNIKAGYDEFALFELGKTHSLDHIDDKGLPGEFEFTGLVIAAADKLKKTGSAYYQARNYLAMLTGAELEFKTVSEAMRQYAVVQPYDLNRSALVSVKASGEFLGIIGEFKPAVSQALKLPKYAAGFEVDTKALESVFKDSKKYVATPRYPKITQDITLKVPADLGYQALSDFVRTELGKVQPANSLTSLLPLDIYQSEEDNTHKNITLRLTIASYERTLTDTEVTNLLDSVAAAAKNKLSAVRI